MKQLFKTYLFVLPDDQVDATESLPVLESSTRKGLYDLVLALCEDSDCHNQLIYLLNQLSIEGKYKKCHPVCLLTRASIKIPPRRRMRLIEQTKSGPQPAMLASITRATSAT